MLPSSPKGPWRTGKTTSAPSRPPPGVSSTAAPAALQRAVAVDPHLDHLVAWLPPAPSSPPRPSAATRRARRSARRSAPPPSWFDPFSEPFGFDFFFFRRRRGGALADDQRHFGARRQFVAAVRGLARHQADLRFVRGFFFLDHRGQARGAHFFHRRATFEADHTRHPHRFAGRRRRRSAPSSPVPVPGRRSATGAARCRRASSIPLRRLPGSARGRGFPAPRGAAACRPGPAP